MVRWNPFLRYPRLSCGLLLCLLLPALWNLRDFGIHSDPRSLLETSPDHRLVLDMVGELVPEEEIVVLDMECPDVFSTEGLSALRRVSDALLSLESAVGIKSLTHSWRPVRRGLGLEMVPLVGGQDLDQLERYCLDNPLIRNVMVSPDGRHTSLILTLAPRTGRVLRRQLEAVLAPFEEEGLVFHIASLSLAEEEIHSWITGDLRRILPMVILFLLVTLGLTLRSLGLVLFVLAHQAITLGVIAGSLHWTDHVPGPQTQLLFPLWAGVHLTLWIHLCTACRGITTGETVPGALARIGRSCLYATLTTLAGLLSLGFTEVAAVREIAWLGAYGLVVVFLMTFGPGAALLHLRKRPWKAPRVRRKPPDWIGFLLRRRRIVLVLAGLCIIGMAVGIPRLDVGIHLSRCLPEESPVRQAGEIFDRHYGGFHFFQLDFDSGQSGGINRLPFLEHLETVRLHAETDPRVTGVYSYPQVLALLNQVWEDSLETELPRSPLLIGTFSLLLRTQLDTLPLLRILCDPPLRKTSLYIRTREMSSGESLDLLEGIAAFAARDLPGDATLHTGSGLASILEADRRIVRSQIASIGIALPVVFLLLWFLWRSPSLALLALGVNIVPVGTVMALAALLGIPLHFITVMTVAIAFGIAIDDTVHLITEWNTARRSGLSSREAIDRALRIKGLPIVCTSLVLGGIFALLLFASFAPVTHFAILTALAFAMALASALGLLPILLAGRHPG